jgi:predicted LPLAT superfamily acyltransferase
MFATVVSTKYRHLALKKINLRRYSNYFQHYANLPNQIRIASLNWFNFNDFIEFGSIQAKFKIRIRFKFGSTNSHNAARLK